MTPVSAEIRPHRKWSRLTVPLRAKQAPPMSPPRFRVALPEIIDKGSQIVNVRWQVVAILGMALRPASFPKILPLSGNSWAVKTRSYLGKERRLASKSGSKGVLFLTTPKIRCNNLRLAATKMTPKGLPRCWRRSAKSATSGFHRMAVWAGQKRATRFLRAAD